LSRHATSHRKKVVWCQFLLKVAAGQKSFPSFLPSTNLVLILAWRSQGKNSVPKPIISCSMTPTSRKSIPTCCSTSPLQNSIFFNATNQISAQNRQPGLKPGTMHADELVISEHAAPPGTSSNDINGVRFRNAMHPPLHSAAQRLRAGAEK
jgi:hypothetical protein